MEKEDNLHRLEGIEDKKGGLVIKKKNPEFKVPQPSLLGLDRLAAERRREREENARKISFTDKDDEEEYSESTKDNPIEKPSSKERHYRTSNQETPSHTGGISNEARSRLIERLNQNKLKEKGVYASTKNERKRSSSQERDSERYRNKYRDEDRYYRKRDKERRDRMYKRSSHRDVNTPSFKDEPLTPNISIKDTTSKTSWDDDDNVPAKRSSWDFPTPSTYKAEEGSERGFRRSEWSERSRRSERERTDRSDRVDRSDRSFRDRKNRKYDNDTPRPTPAHKFNTWMKNRRKTGATPSIDKKENEKLKWESEEDAALWEEEQKRIDREWYNIGEGYDDENNPFSSVSDDYTKKKEEQLEQRKKKRISAQQRQINKDNELWERNRMLTSGVVHSVDFNEDFDEESLDRVHLLVHNVVPPFLDGRIVFTKQPEPVIPVR